MNSGLITRPALHRIDTTPRRPAVFVFIRVYRFKRRCGLSRRAAFTRALQTVVRDFNLRSPL